MISRRQETVESLKGAEGEIEKLITQGLIRSIGKGAEYRRIDENTVEITLTQSAIDYRLINLSQRIRDFFPGYKVPFEMEADGEVFEAKVTSAPKGTPIGDERKGSYLRGLDPFFRHHPRLRRGSRIRIRREANMYKLEVLAY